MNTPRSTSAVSALGNLETPLERRLLVRVTCVGLLASLAQGNHGNGKGTDLRRGRRRSENGRQPLTGVTLTKLR